MQRKEQKLIKDSKKTATHTKKELSKKRKESKIQER